MAADAMSIRTGRFARSGFGFSLIELLVAVAIVGILAAIAVPSYQNSVRKSRRADAKATLTETAQRLERCMTQYGAYDDGNCVVAGGPSPEGYYTIGVVRTATTYTVNATTRGAQTTDTACNSLALSHLGAKTALDSDGNAAGDCW